MSIFWLSLHSYLRWGILGAALLLSVSALHGYFTNRHFSKLDNRFAVLYITLLHSQLLVGLWLYFFVSPITSNPLPQGWMKVPSLRFAVLEHPTLMVLAIIAAQLGRILSKKAASDKKKFIKGATWCLISLLLLMLGIPWRGSL